MYPTFVKYSELENDAKFEHVVGDESDESRALSPTPSSASEERVNHPPAPFAPFSYTAYNSSTGLPVRVHVCSNLETFAAALEHLKGENVLGIDVEHQPFGETSKKGEKRMASEEAIQFVQDANDTANAVASDWNEANPDSPCKLQHKKGYVSGLITGGEYVRFAGYTKAQLSLLQLASTSHVVLAHFAAFPHQNAIADPADFIPELLRSIMEDEKIIKCGVAVFGEDSDTQRLSRYFNVPSNGLLELNHLDATTQEVINTRAPFKSLKSLTEEYLERTLIGKSKSADRTTVSEWQLPHLSRKQVEYAANDAFVSVKLYEAMIAKRVALASCPPMPVCVSEVGFDYVAFRDDRIKRLQAKGTSSSKRKLRSLGMGQAPSSPLEVPEGGSRSEVQSQNRRKDMSMEDSKLADALTKLRNEKMNERGLDPTNSKEKFRVIEDRLIDRIAKTNPRPQTVDALLDIMPEGKRSPAKFGRYAEEFLQVVIAHPPAAIADNAVKELMEKDELPVTVIQHLDGKAA